MKIVLQNFKTGKLFLTDTPPPNVGEGGVLVNNVASLISAGTEKAIIELAKMNPLQKAKTRPDLVRKILKATSQYGLLDTVNIVRNLASSPIPLGYSCSGMVKTLGKGVTDLQPGTRVACAGLGYANHAEVIFVPRNLVVPIPKEVSYEEAAFVTVGAIATHGVRQAETSLGENVVVIGLGLVGQIVAQICTAAGYRVFGVDLDPVKVKLALELGIEGGMTVEENVLVDTVKRFTRQRGADAIIIAASGSNSKTLDLAIELARDRARIVVLGDVELKISRRAFYEKELELRISRSYGPGRHDVSYEEKGNDYPLSYVRWTENRNMESFVDLLAAGKVQIKPLITHRYPIEQAETAYKLLSGKQRDPYIGILLEYDIEKKQTPSILLKNSAEKPDSKNKKTGTPVNFGVIGAGQFAQGILLPKLQKIKDVNILGIATGSGLTARNVCEKYDAHICTSDYQELLSRDDIDALIIATRHNLHAQMIVESLLAGKHVFVEKPLANTEEELKSVEQAYMENQKSHNGGQNPLLMVGFNRRFSSISQKLKNKFQDGPFIINYRINAGSIPSDHWAQDPEIGGGRLVGEICHFIDFMQFFTNSYPVEVFAWALDNRTVSFSDPDNICVQLRFAEGSLGTITYVSNGDSMFPKERVEIFAGGKVGLIDNWKKLEIWSGGKKSVKRSFLSSTKGHSQELEIFVEEIISRRLHPPIEFESLLRTTRATFAIQTSLKTGKPVLID